MNLNRVVLTRYEGEWFARNVLKTLTILEAHAKKDEKILKRTTYKVLSAVKTQAEQMEAAIKAFGDEEYELELTLNRKQKLVIRDLVSKTIVSLEGRVLPEYERRGDKDRTEDTKYKIDLLNKMQRKFK